MKITSLNLTNLFLKYGSDIIFSPGMEYEKTQRQHGGTTCFEHSISVAYISVWLALKLRQKVDFRSLIRGALLHDYFLYDWRDKQHKWHAFHHASTALENASRDFILNEIEKDIIARHMFPLNLTPPKYKESLIVCFSDKISAFLELSAIFLPIQIPGGKLTRRLL